jgi:hypothetical protein
MWFDSTHACEAYLASAWRSMRPRAQTNFPRLGRTVVMPVDVHVIKGGLIPDNAVNSIESSTGDFLPDGHLLIIITGEHRVV